MSMVFLTKRLSYMCAAFFIGAAIIGVLVKAATTIPTLPPAFTIGSIIQVTTITIHHNLGPRGDFWVTTDESSPLPPPRVSAKSTQEMLDSHRVQRKYWLYRPHADGPDFLRGDSFVDDGPIGTAKSADILLEATMPEEGTIVNVECLDDGTYRAGLWVNEKRNCLASCPPWV